METNAVAEWARKEAVLWPDFKSMQGLRPNEEGNKLVKDVKSIQ